MTKLEIACVVGGLVGIFLYQPTSYARGKTTLADILLFIFLMLRNVIFFLMIIVPLYFRVWRGL
jgi:hypothetical protein